MEPTDRELHRRLVDGDSQAWAVLVKRYSESLWQVTGTYRLDAASRKDVVQTVWLRLHHRIDSIRDPDRLIGWLVRVTRNECVNLIRQQSRCVDTGGDELIEPTTETPNPTQRLEQQQVERAVAAAFEQLDERCRQLLALLMAEPPIPYDEIGHLIGMPRGSVGPTRQRCLKKMRALAPIAELDPKRSLP